MNCIAAKVVLYTLLLMSNGKIIPHIFASDSVFTVRKNNVTLGMFTDGVVCYVTHDPKIVSCHRSITWPSYGVFQNKD